MANSEAKNRWDRANTVTFSVKYMRKSDADLLALFAECEAKGISKNAIIKIALREYIERHKEDGREQEEDRSNRQEGEKTMTMIDIYNRTHNNCLFYEQNGDDKGLLNEIGVLRGIMYCMEVTFGEDEIDRFVDHAEFTRLIGIQQKLKGEKDMEKKYIVLPEYRDLWSNDPKWDGMTDMAEIERLAREWGKTVEDLLEQVEEA